MKGCRPLSRSEIELLETELNQRDRVLMLCSLYFGLRVSEALRLRFADFAGKFLSIRSSKGSENLSLPIPARVKQSVDDLREAYRKAGDPAEDTSSLFHSQMTGGPISSRLFQMNLKRACQKLGIQGAVSTHSFRKCFAEEIWNLSGKNIVTVQKYLRQKSVGNTIYYIQTLDRGELIDQLDFSNRA